MYSSPCWPPAARIVLLRVSTGDTSEILKEIGSKVKEKISTWPLPSKSKDSLGYKAIRCEVQFKQRPTRFSDLSSTPIPF